MAGCSQTLLAKPGIKTGFKVKLVNARAHYFELLTDWPGDVVIVDDSDSLINFPLF